MLALPKSLAVALALTVPLAPLAAQSTTAASKPRPATRNPRPAAATAAPAVAAPLAAPYDSLAFAALKWREIGPFRGGRSVAVAGTASRPMEYWFGTTGAGVFKTVDGGYSWAPMSDKYFGGTVGAIGVAASNPDVVYVGTGEYPIRGNVSHGDGVFKTVDGGKTWTYMGLKETEQISRVRVHPTNPDVVYVGAMGHVYAPNAERGVFRTRDGGKTWQKILFRNDSTGVTDLVMDPTNPNVLYASFWQAGRKPWQLISGGAGSGIFKTVDGGDHWTEITRNPGLPAGVLGNIGLTVSAVKPSRLWALVEADSGGVFRSDDGGATWTRTNQERKLRQRAWYYSRIFADTRDTNTVYALNTGMYRSVDGGKTFKNIPVPHGDNHDLWIAPNDHDRMIESNDGGANVSFNAGKTWSQQDQATAQFYHVIATNHFPYQVCGAQQDNSTLCGPSRAPGGIGIDQWKDAGGGESGYIASRPDQPDIVYAGSYGGLTTRKDLRTGLERDVNPWPDNPMGHSAEDLKYRFQWTFPIVLSPFDPKTLYVGANVLFKSTNEGQTFTAISPDLTRHDPATLGASGGPITKDQTSVEYYATIFSVAESPVTRGVIWSGSDDGKIFVTRNGGTSWSDVSPKDWGEWLRISSIEPSHTKPGTAYVAANRYQLDDKRPYLFRTDDYGKSWTRLDGTRVDGATNDGAIASNEFTRVLREDPEKPGLLYAGTERGVWVSFDDGARWQRLQLNLPHVPVHDLTIKDGDLVAATHGRSFWILDDVSAIRQLTPAIVAGNAHLFQPRDVYRVNWGGGFLANRGNAASPVGQNPASGAVVAYWLKSPRQEVTVDFLDASGKVIRSFTSKQDSATAADSVKKITARRDSLTRAGVSADSIKKLEAKSEGPGEGSGGGGEEDEEAPRRAPRPPRVPNKAGLNTFVWNLRYPDASTFDNLIMWAGGTQGPIAPPGTYTVRLTTGGASETRTFKLERDPRSSATDADLRAQFAFLVKIRDRVSEANDAVKTIRNVRAQLEDREKQLGAKGATDLARFKTVSSQLTGQLGAVEQEIYQVRNQSSQDPLNYPIKLNNRISALAGVVGGADARPTDQSYAVFNGLSAELDKQLAAMKHTMTDLLPQANAVLKSAGLAAIVPSTAEIKPPTAAVAASSGTDEE
ncbi:MAG TPA: glycosyl hydrolase [Gemmatimonadaceae bacterium]|nr:glycosyl hydrolase [Gemmatimonadaceae bacterium]